MTKHSRKVFAAALAAMICPGYTAHGQNPTDRLWHGFSTAQDTARTKVWWFHGETETTREGITADLEAYRRAGVGGVVYYDQVHGDGEGALDAFTPEWWRMFVFAASEARRLGLSFETNLSNGFVAGGPWITPRLSMQMLIAADTVVRGGYKFQGEISLPVKKNSWKADVAVLAFPKPKTGWQGRQMLAERTFKGGESGRHHYVTVDMGSKFTARSISYKVNGRIKTMARAMNLPGPPAEKFYGTGYFELPALGELEVSDDGVNFRKAAVLKPFYNANTKWSRMTVAFPATTGRYFRLNLHDWWPEKDSAKDMKLTDVVLSPEAMVDLWPQKAGLVSDHILNEDTPEYGASEVIDPTTVINITDRLQPDGRLEWQMPDGEWVIMRFASIPTGGKTKHGRRNLMGPECDKMSAEAAEVQWRSYFKVMNDTLRQHGMAIDGLVMDSHEAGAQNWTPGFEHEFRRLRGYDLMCYLPVMAGHVVGDSRRSAGVLYDVRRTVADLISYRYFATLDSLCRTEGASFTAQAVGNGLAITGDPIQAKGRVDKPQGEFWTHHPDGNYDIKECSSAAHIYGKSIASGEAFTGTKFYHTPGYIKTLADYAYCYGLNEFVYCASAYQPWTDKTPGSTGGGRHYCLNRNSGYWPYMQPFWDYQARCSFMMRQGRPVTDLCVYIGENAPIKIMSHRLPDIPGGTDFDAFTTDALLTRMTASNGRVTLPDGHSYAMMTITTGGELTLKALRKIASLVHKGISLYADKPRLSPTAADADSLAVWQELTEEIWGDGKGIRTYGKGTVYCGMTLSEAMAEAGISSDISMDGTDMKAEKIMFAHRHSPDTDIYFVDNHANKSINGTFTMRSTFRCAEWWDAVTGTRQSLPSTATADGRTSITLALDPHEAGFIVLSDKPAAGLSQRTTHTTEEVLPIENKWNVWFDPKMGGPGRVLMNKLTDWTLSADTAIRYYSGTARYETTFKYGKRKAGERVLLRFARLADIARITVNGRQAGIVWCSPWQADISDFIRKGKNTLCIEVANSQMNRMIIDSALPENERVTYARPIVASPKDKLCPSGIIGTVNLIKHTP